MVPPLGNAATAALNTPLSFASPLLLVTTTWGPASHCCGTDAAAACVTPVRAPATTAGIRMNSIRFMVSPNGPSSPIAEDERGGGTGLVGCVLFGGGDPPRPVAIDTC